MVSKTSIRGENEWERMGEGEGGQVKDIGQSSDRRRRKLHPVTFNHPLASSLARYLNRYGENNATYWNLFICSVNTKIVKGNVFFQTFNLP